jgi:dihydrofolate synthase/folylpolyglutamate synthase
MAEITASASRFAADGDEVFFREREQGRRCGKQRSLARATTLAELLDIPRGTDRVTSDITVVGSKGKGTAATFAAATLAAAGLRVGLLTSPGFRTNRERIRIDGHAIDPSQYGELVHRVTDALEKLDVSPSADDGYLAPTGIFTIAAVRHFIDAQCDAIVLEAGMGGGHDEVSLFPARVVACSPIFGEHLGVLGDTVGDIAREKLGIVTDSTRALLIVRQYDPEAAMVLHETREAPLTVVTDAPVSCTTWPPAPITDNAWLGVAAGLQALSLRGLMVDASLLQRTLATVHLPGRLSIHERRSQRWLVDAASNQYAVTRALAYADAQWNGIDTVVPCIPDGKDVAGVQAALADANCIPVRTDAPHLTFHAWERALPSLSQLDVDSLGDPVVAVGTVHFVGDVLELLDVPTENAFTVVA